RFNRFSTTAGRKCCSATSCKSRVRFRYSLSYRSDKCRRCAATGLGTRNRIVQMENPFHIFDSIRQAYLRYLDSPFRLRYQALLNERRALLDRDGQLYREPLYEPISPYESSGLTAIEA